MIEIVLDFYKLNFCHVTAEDLYFYKRKETFQLHSTVYQKMNYIRGSISNADLFTACMLLYSELLCTLNQITALDRYISPSKL